MRKLCQLKLNFNVLIVKLFIITTAYEYVADSEITEVTLQSAPSEEDLLDKVNRNLCKCILFSTYIVRT